MSLVKFTGGIFILKKANKEHGETEKNHGFFRQTPWRKY